MEQYAAYLALLKQLTGTLEELSGLAREKLEAVKNDDLDRLNQTLRREQALSLSVRSLEQKMRTDLEKLGLADVPLRELPERYPESLRAEAKATSEALRRQYQVYKGVAGAARAALECGLHEIEKALGDTEPMEIELPARLRTDIHA
jgi:conjugal transfer/entry exclusion protein